MTDNYFEEEEFDSQFTGKTLLRITQLAKSHWKWVIGFVLMISTVSVLDSYFTYLSSRIIDEGILGEEHFEALEQFWQYTKDNPRNKDQIEKQVAYVLPKDYGYGFRGPEDKIWGLWMDDVTSLEMSHHLGFFLEEYGTKLDIIYDDNVTFNEVYSKYIFWNGTIISGS